MQLYEKGLIYRGNRIINWCPTAILRFRMREVEYAERRASLACALR